MRPAYVDQHSVAAAAPPAQAYATTRAWAQQVAGRRYGVVGRLWGLQPASGFAVVTDHRPRVVGLAGRHRFSRYLLELRVDPGPGGSAAGSVVTAVTYADFSGVRGQVYRTLVVRSGAHRVVTRAMLRRLARRAVTG